MNNGALHGRRWGHSVLSPKMFVVLCLTAAPLRIEGNATIRLQTRVEGWRIEALGLALTQLRDAGGLNGEFKLALD